jgi:hypothetical protein
LKPVFIIAIVAVAMIGVMFPSVIFKDASATWSAIDATYSSDTSIQNIPSWEPVGEYSFFHGHCDDVLWVKIHTQRHIEVFLDNEKLEKNEGGFGISTSSFSQGEHTLKIQYGDSVFNQIIFVDKENEYSVESKLNCMENKLNKIANSISFIQNFDHQFGTSSTQAPIEGTGEWQYIWEDAGEKEYMLKIISTYDYHPSLGQTYYVEPNTIPRDKFYSVMDELEIFLMEKNLELYDESIYELRIAVDESSLPLNEKDQLLEHLEVLYFKDYKIFKNNSFGIPEYTDRLKIEYEKRDVKDKQIAADNPHIEYINEKSVNEPIVKQVVNCGPGTKLVNGICQIVQTQKTEEIGGGCLIATATYGSELAPQVQQLRELRDNQLLQTESGIAFMGTFNDVYYSFSPIIADYERENPLFKETVKLAITPMISSLSLMENANSESEVLGIGISVIMLNLGMYLGVPAIVVVGIKKKF